MTNQEIIITGQTIANETHIGGNTAERVGGVIEGIGKNLTELGGKLALGAVYDVSAENPTAGPNSDGKWETLSTLLSDANLNTLIPTALRKGGMSIKFIQSSDNKYVQYMYKGTATTGSPNPFLNVANWEKINLEEEVVQLKRDVLGENKILIENITTEPSKVYITSDMVSAGDILVFELQSLNNLIGVLRAEKTGYVFDDNIAVNAGETATVNYTVPADFLRIFTQSIANPMTIVSCRRTSKGAIDDLQEEINSLSSGLQNLSKQSVKTTDITQESGNNTGKVTSQDLVTKLVDSPFITAVPDALRGIVAFSFNTIENDPLPVKNFKQFRVSSIYMTAAWNLSIQIQASTDGTTWGNYDGIDRLATDAPNPLPTIEIIESKVKRFKMVVNWPMMGSASLSNVSYILKKDAPNYLLEPILKLPNYIQSVSNSPFSIEVPQEMRGIVSFRMNNVAGNNMPVDNYAHFRVSSIYRTSTWNLSMQIQKSIDGSTWTNYDAIDRRAADAPSPLPVIEEITSKYGAFTVIINWQLMGTISKSSVDYRLKTDAPNYFVRKLQEQINEIHAWPVYGDYEQKDYIKHTVSVDASGNGDYTSIADAYAAITDSDYDNQYEIVVYPGTYNEYNLIPPKFTHTHGLIPNSVIVTSEGVSSTLPVFDQRVPCKLSNMTIISGTGYCVHQDQTTLGGIVIVNENLYCRKVYGQDVSNFTFRGISNPAILGIGSHIHGAKFVWNNCVFVDGKIGMHTIGGDITLPANQHLIFNNCKITNAYFDLGVAGASSKVGNFVFEVNGLYTEKGRPSLMCVLGSRSSGDTSYNYYWQILGGQNKNFVVMTENGNDPLTDDVWPNVNTNDITFVQLASGVSASKGQFIDISGSLCNASTPKENVIGMALEDGSAGDNIRVHTGCFAYNSAFNTSSFPVTTNDGEYGIGSDGRLLKDANIIIGMVKYNNFYRSHTD